MSRRGENIRKRKDRRWEGRYYKVEEKSGTRKISSIYARNYGEVKEKLVATKASAECQQKEFMIERNLNLEGNATLEGSLNEKEEISFHMATEK